MDQLYPALALFLGLNLVAGLLRIARGPTPSDRMLAAQLFGTTGVAILLLLSEAGDPALQDVALVFAVLTVVNAIVFVRSGVGRTAAGPRR
jgi:multicomponent Na+:H+ antiporter subunit F